VGQQLTELYKQEEKLPATSHFSNTSLNHTITNQAALQHHTKSTNGSLITRTAVAQQMLLQQKSVLQGTKGGVTNNHTTASTQRSGGALYHTNITANAALSQAQSLQSSQLAQHSSSNQGKSMLQASKRSFNSGVGGGATGGVCEDKENKREFSNRQQ
jgi:hypothetical protein